MVVDVYNTTININDDRVYSSSFYPGRCCCGMYTMNSCFGFGFGGLERGIGFGLGFGAAMSIIPMLPQVFPKIVSGVKWLATDVIAPFACKVGKFVGDVASSAVKGVKKLWNKIFHKKPKDEKEAQKA